MKIISSGKVLHSPEFHKKKQKQTRLKRISLVGIFLIFILLPIFLSRQERFLISAVVVEGSSGVPEESISSLVKNSLSGNYLWVFPKSNALIYPRRELEEKLLEEIPRLRSAEINLTDSRTLEITVEEREPFALYCEDASNLPLLSNCYFIDDIGYIFDEAPAFSGDVYFIYLSRVPIENPLDKQFLPREKFEALPPFIERIASVGVYPQAFEVVDGEYHFILGNGARIMWNESDDMQIIETNLKAFLTDEAVAREENFLGRIIYLDLRTENKVFYRFRE